MNKVVVTLLLSYFFLLPWSAQAEEYGTPAPLDPALMQGVSGGKTSTSANKPTSSSSGQVRKPINRPANSGTKADATRQRGQLHQPASPSGRAVPQANKPRDTRQGNKPVEQGNRR